MALALVVTGIAGHGSEKGGGARELGLCSGLPWSEELLLGLLRPARGQRGRQQYQWQMCDVQHGRVTRVVYLQCIKLRDTRTRQTLHTSKQRLTDLRTWSMPAAAALDTYPGAAHRPTGATAGRATGGGEVACQLTVHPRWSAASRSPRARLRLRPGRGARCRCWDGSPGQPAAQARTDSVRGVMN